MTTLEFRSDVVDSEPIYDVEPEAVQPITEDSHEIVAPAWAERVGITLTSEEVDFINRPEHAATLSAWVLKRESEMHNRYALGLEASPSLARSFAKKLRELQQYSN